MYNATQLDVYTKWNADALAETQLFTCTHGRARVWKNKGGGRRAAALEDASTMMIYAIVLSTDFCAAAISCVLCASIWKEVALLMNAIKVVINYHCVWSEIDLAPSFAYWKRATDIFKQ
jgi:hypothetical protein